MDVCILAGGRGTRLAGVWDGPKCMVPVGGVPVLKRILQKVVAEIAPDNVVISLGSQTMALEVINWWSYIQLHPISEIALCGTRVNFAVEPAPLGRLRALVSCLPALTPPILVLNGDTLPRYDLRMLGEHPGVAICGGRYAGAYVIDNKIALYMRDYAGTDYDLDTVLAVLTKRQIAVPGFLDIGTPQGFAEAQQLDAAEG
jgi:hypothetical protein